MTTVIDSVIDVHIGPEDLEDALASDVAAGLTAAPKELPPKWFYDARGSQLFDEITRLDEYYPTGAEREILDRVAGDIIDTAGAGTIVELGSGSAEKTLTLLDVARSGGELERFIPFDVSETHLRRSAEELTGRYPGLLVHGVVGDFDRHLGCIPGGGRRLVIMLGSTIGNYRPRDRVRLLADIAATLQPGDHLLLGADLVKDTDRLVLAYDDPHGVTAAFNLNLLRVINRELGADFDTGAFVHAVHYDPYHERIEMYLRSQHDQIVRIERLGLEVPFRRDELMRTETSAKFRRSGLEAELAVAGLGISRWWTDSRGDFGVSLSVRE